MNEKNDYYTWITENMAVGELNANYEPFNIIVNLAYINPNFNRSLKHREDRQSLKDNKKIYEFGLYDTDSDTEYLLLILNKFFDNDLLNELKNKKILFHCQSGKSRSVMFAITYLRKLYSLSYIQALDIIKEKRPIANPRLAFTEMCNRNM